jgi:hypothetical protein
VRRLIFEAVNTGNGAEIRAVLFFQTACHSDGLPFSGGHQYLSACFAAFFAAALSG